MEKEKVLEIEITKINDDWSAITVKKIKKDFKNNDFFEWLTIGGNYLYDGKIFVNRCYSNIPFLIRNEIIEHLEEIVNKITNTIFYYRNNKGKENGVLKILDKDKFNDLDLKNWKEIGLNMDSLMWWVLIFQERI